MPQISFGRYITQIIGKFHRVSGGKLPILSWKMPLCFLEGITYNVLGVSPVFFLETISVLQMISLTSDYHVAMPLFSALFGVTVTWANLCWVMMKMMTKVMMMMTMTIVMVMMTTIVNTWANSQTSIKEGTNASENVTEVERPSLDHHKHHDHHNHHDHHDHHIMIKSS